MSRSLSREIQNRTLELIRSLFANRFTVANNSTDESDERDEWTLASYPAARLEDEWDDDAENWLASTNDEE